MILNVMDTDFNMLASIDSYTSLLTERCHYEVGTLELHINPKSVGANMLVDGVIVFADPKRPYLLQDVYTTESKTGMEVVAHGIQLKGITERRLTVPDITAETLTYGYDRYPVPSAPEESVEAIIRHYVDKHMINPAEPKRKFSRLVLATNQDRGVKTRWSSRFEPLSTVFKDIGEFCGMGYDITLDLDNKQFVFDCNPGVTRTITSETPVIFSVDWGNLDSSKYTVETKNYANTGYAGGAGEAEARLIQIVYESDLSVSGFGRREKWLDCGSVDMYDDLIYEGKYKLKELEKVQSLTGDISPTGSFLYGRDWELGDIVTLQSKAVGLERDVQITVVKETTEPGKRDVNVTFGKRRSTILDEIRKTEVAR